MKSFLFLCSMKACNKFVKGDDTELRLGGGIPTGKQLQIVWKVPRFRMTSVGRNFQYYGTVNRFGVKKWN